MNILHLLHIWWIPKMLVQFSYSSYYLQIFQEHLCDSLNLLFGHGYRPVWFCYFCICGVHDQVGCLDLFEGKLGVLCQSEKKAQTLILTTEYLQIFQEQKCDPVNIVMCLWHRPVWSRSQGVVSHWDPSSYFAFFWSQKRTCILTEQIYASIITSPFKTKQIFYLLFRSVNYKTFSKKI